MSRAKRIYTITDITNKILRLIRSDPELQRVWLKGEISNFKHHSSGHIYLTLKDSRSSIAGVMFRSSAKTLKFKPHDGMKIIVSGEITVYPPYGKYQVVIQTMQPEGWGELHLAYLELKDKLEKEGLFDPAGKKPLPGIPEHIGLVTSPTGAAVRDMISVLRRRYPLVKVTLYPALCQGVAAPESLIAGLNYFESKTDVDLVIIGRGGGSLEDLWAFNDEKLARVIYKMEKPVISAVGHEIDFTICDFAADIRAATPTEAAEIAVPDKNELLVQFNDLNRRLTIHIKRLLYSHKQNMGRHKNSLRYYHPMNMLKRMVQSTDVLHDKLHNGILRKLREISYRIETLKNRVDVYAPGSILKRKKIKLADYSKRLILSTNRIIKYQEQRVKNNYERLKALNPRAVLKRGYSITLDKHSKALREASKTGVGEALDIILYRGSLRCKVEELK